MAVRLVFLINSKYKLAWLVGGLLVLASGVSAQQKPSPAIERQFAASQAGNFIENRGQWDPRVKFLARSSGIDSWITKDGVVYDFHKFAPDAKHAKMRPGGKEPQMGRRVGDVVRVSFAGARPAEVKAIKELPGKLNYMIGNDRRKWAIGVRRFTEAKTQDLYKGISARYYFENGAPRYDLVIAPGANPSKIHMQFKGARSVALSASGTLKIDTSVGTIEERGLYAYQDSGRGQKQVACRMDMEGKNLGFMLGAYDRSKPLVIDPLIFSTYLGGSTDDQCSALALDSSGNVVVAGSTASYDFPVTAGAYQTINKTGVNNGTCFVAKLSANGQSLIYGTYLGGSGGDGCSALALDSSGNVVVAGGTASSDFPITAGAYQTTNKVQSSYDDTGFVAKLSADGTSLLYGTYLGGSTSDSCNALALDSYGNAVVAGYSSSTDFPVTPNAYQTTNNSRGIGIPGDFGTCFVAKLSASGQSLLYGTYLGGSALDYCNAVALDSSGNAVAAGYTLSSDFPVTSGAYQTKNLGVNLGGKQTGFLAKLSANGESLLCGTYFGGSAENYCSALALDSSGNVVVAGNTLSSDFPVTSNAYQTKIKGNNQTGFVAKLSANGQSLLYGTYLGGSTAESQIEALALDSSGNAAVAGSTQSTDFPVTSNAYQTTNNNAFTLVGFVAKLSANGQSLLYGTYLGGGSTAESQIEALALDSSGNPVVAGATASTDFPVYPLNAYQTTNKTVGKYTGFITKLSIPIPAALTGVKVAPTSVLGGTNSALAVYLNGFAESGGTVVNLSSNSPAATVSATITVPQGATDANVAVHTVPVSASTLVTFTATFGLATLHATLTVNPAGLSSVRVAPSPVVGGNNSAFAAYLSGAAGPGGTVVTLLSGSAGVTLPASLMVPAGSTAANVVVHTTPVGTSMPVTITATLGSSSLHATLTVNPAALSTARVAPSPVLGGNNSAFAVYLNGAAGPGGTVVTLSSGSTSVALPSTLTVPAGATAANVVVHTTSVSSSTPVTITATLGSTSLHATLTVNPAALVSVRLAPTTVVSGSNAAFAVYLNGAAGPGGTVVTLTSSSTSATIPATITVPAGATAANVQVHTSGVTSATPVTLTATLGSASFHTTLTINP